GEPVVVPHVDLQFKGNRYYFRDTFELEKGKVFFSPLDLNIEKGVVEIPGKPMIRAGIPVFDDKGEKKGILLLNYLGQNLFNIIQQSSGEEESRVFLLNADSYWLYSQDPEKNWAFMYKDKQDVNFKSVHPSIWAVINSAGCGTIRESKGIYIFTTVTPLRDCMQTSTGSPEAEGISADLEPEDYFWKMVSYLPDTALKSLAGRIAGKMLLLMTVVITGAILLAIMLSKLWFVQKTSEHQVRKSLEEKELLLREIHHRVKNSLALVSSFVGLYQGEHTEQSNDEFFDAIQQKIDTISLVHTYLYQSSDIENISLKSYLRVLLDNLLQNLAVSTGNVELNLDLEDIFMAAKETISIGLIISELAMNSLKYAFPDKQKGRISVQIARKGQKYIIIYSDDGIGLSKDYATRGSDSLGIVLVEALTQQLNGSLSITTGPNSTFTIRFPVIN
ncbi:MAG: sensor histidine kinase, partial [Spirochaetales bacterium]|nr:sensor histidine kinase [Spirochaetales bacterium]